MTDQTKRAYLLEWAKKLMDSCLKPDADPARIFTEASAKLESMRIPWQRKAAQRKGKSQ